MIIQIRRNPPLQCPHHHVVILQWWYSLYQRCYSSIIQNCSSNSIDLLLNKCVYLKYVLMVWLFICCIICMINSQLKVSLLFHNNMCGQRYWKHWLLFCLSFLQKTSMTLKFNRFFSSSAHILKRLWMIHSFNQ